MKINQKQLRKLIENLRTLEIIQTQNRKNVRTALKIKDKEAIKYFSQAIRINRRKPNGLRDLNNTIRQVLQLNIFISPAMCGTFCYNQG